MIESPQVESDEGVVDGNWLQTDESDDVASSVRHAYRSWTFTEEDIHEWKWVALALHSALQGACVCHLVTTASPVGAVTKRNAKEWLSYFESSRGGGRAKLPETCLLPLPDLLKLARKPRSAGDRSNEQGIRVSDSEYQWIRSFHYEIRNQFTHFDPRGWSIEVSGLPKLAYLIARIIEDILEAGWAFRHQDGPWRTALRSGLGDLRRMQVC